MTMPLRQQRQFELAIRQKWTQQWQRRVVDIHQVGVLDIHEVVKAYARLAGERVEWVSRGRG